jgi:hypothetical protein
MKVEELENKRIRIAKTIKNTPNTKPTTRSAFDLMMGLSVDFVIELAYEFTSIYLIVGPQCQFLFRSPQSIVDTDPVYPIALELQQ